MGYPGAGKTTTAKVIHELTGAKHLWADHLRKKRFITPRHTMDEHKALYGSMNEQTTKLLAEGKSVIFDTNFNYYRDRKRLRDIAAQAGANTKLLWVVVPKELANKRATVHSDHPSNTTRMLGNMAQSVFERLSNNLEPPQPDEPYIEIDGTKVTPEYITEKLK